MGDSWPSSKYVNTNKVDCCSPIRNQAQTLQQTGVLAAVVRAGKN